MKPCISGVYNNACVMFCDVVAFTHIVGKYDVSEVLEMLTQLHRIIEHACDIHGTHRVRTTYAG